MGNWNQVILLGRATRDPEAKDFANGGKVAQFGFAVDGNKKKNQATGQWENEPCFLDCKAFNSTHENGRKLADTIMQYVVKGKELFISGKLVMESWNAQDGTKRTAIRVVVEDIQFVGPKPADGSQSGHQAPAQQQQAPQQPNYAGAEGDPF